MRKLGFKSSVNLEKGIEIMVEWARVKGPQKFVHLNELELLGKNAPKTWSKKLL